MIIEKLCNFFTISIKALVVIYVNYNNEIGFK